MVIMAGFLIDKLGNRCKFMCITFANFITYAKDKKGCADLNVCPMFFTVGVFLFSFLCVLGSSLFALGSHFKGSPYLLPLMLTGRLLFGSGNGSLTSKRNITVSYLSLQLVVLEAAMSLRYEQHLYITFLMFFRSVVQNRITAFWFKGKELALAFGLTLAFSRLGSVLNFFLTQKFEEQYGIQWTLWGGKLISRFPT